MNRYSLFLILTLGACASGSAPNYTPNEGAYESWRACRVAYEQDHMPAPDYSAQSLLLGGFIGASAGGFGDEKLAGPEMDKAVNTCMKAKGYNRN